MVYYIFDTVISLHNIFMEISLLLRQDKFSLLIIQLNCILNGLSNLFPQFPCENSPNRILNYNMTQTQITFKYSTVVVNYIVTFHSLEIYSCKLYEQCVVFQQCIYSEMNKLNTFILVIEFIITNKFDKQNVFI